MTPKEKARELIDKFANFECDDNYEVFESSISSIEAIQCALICVDELMKDNAINEEIVNGGLNFQYWKEVKKEIEKL
jgi:hypothetical protein